MMAEIDLQPGETIEQLGKSQLKIIQHKDSYRFSLDSLLLSQFVKVKNREKIIDLGTGCGIIPLMIYHPTQRNRIYGVEIQDKLVRIAQKNVMINHLENQISILHDDAKNLRRQFHNEFFDVITTNPPYIAFGKGKISMKDDERLARHEILLTLENIMSICSFLLKKGGRLYLIHRADSFIPVVMSLKKYHLEPKLLQFVFTRKNHHATRFLLEARKEGGTELRVLTPLFLNH